VRWRNHSAALEANSCQARQSADALRRSPAAACVFSASLCQVDAASAASGLPSDQIRLLICLLAAVPLGPSRRCSLCPTAPLRAAATEGGSPNTSFDTS
jgi:hypothetical protein